MTRTSLRWLVAGALGLGGCSKMTMDGKMAVDGTLRLEGPIQVQIQSPAIRYTGVYVSEDLLDRVEVKRTRIDWVLAVFGEPTERAALDDGSEIWKWAYRPLMQDTPLFTLLETGKDKAPRPQQSITFLQIRDGLVVDKWQAS